MTVPSRRLRVAFDAHATIGRPTGIGIAARELLSALTAEADDDVEIHAIGSGHGPRSRAGTLARLRWEQVTLPRRARAVRPDVLHLPGFGVPWRRPCPTVVTVHDLIGARVRTPGVGAPLYWGRVQPATLRWAHAIIASSAFTRDEIVSVLGVPRERVTVIHLAVPRTIRPPAPGASARVASRIGASRPFVLTVGSIEPRKNVPLLVEAFARLRTSRPDLDLVVVGQPAGDESAVDGVIRQAGLEASVHRLGYVPGEDLPDLYAACACFAFPSAAEGFGLPPLEAMACGAPVVAARCASLPEILGDAALLVGAPPSAGELAAALGDVLDRPELAERLREAGLRRAASFSWARAARQTLGVYRSVAAGRRD